MITRTSTATEVPTLQELLARIDETRPILERNVAQTEATDESLRRTSTL